MTLAPRATRAWPWIESIVALGACWLLVCEGLRERASWALVLVMLGPWVVLTVSFAARLSLARRSQFGLLAALLALDIAVDIWLPYRWRFTVPQWELLHLTSSWVGTEIARRGALPHRFRSLPRLVRALTVLAVSVVAITAAWIARDGVRDQTCPADAAVVLGFGLDGNGRAQPSMIGRVDHAAMLYRRGLVGRLVLTGGSDGEHDSEASVMRTLLLARGVPAEDLFLEQRSSSTRENLAYAAPILRRLGARRALLVTEPFHLPRAVLIARRHRETEFFRSPALSSAWSDPRTGWYWVFRDAPLWLIEWVRGRLLAADTRPPTHAHARALSRSARSRR